MVAPLPRWSDPALRVAAAATVVLATTAIAGPMIFVRSPVHTAEGEVLSQPVRFDHRHHVQADGIRCGYCHYDADRAATAGMPDTQLCMGCHRQIHPESPSLAPVRESHATGEPIRWARVYDLPDFDFFEHAPHVHAGVGCESCHGRVDQMAGVSLAHSLSMGWCLDCHRDPAPHLRPPEAVEVMGYEGPWREDADVDPPTHCSGCHR